MANAFSLEDKNLDVSTILTSRTRAYKDIDLTFYLLILKLVELILLSRNLFKATNPKRGIVNSAMTNIMDTARNLL